MSDTDINIIARFLNYFKHFSCIIENNFCFFCINFKEYYRRYGLKG